jgi:CheY-like chemotaxis protein
LDHNVFRDAGRPLKTSFSLAADFERAQEEAGFDYHLVKPIDPEKLQTVLETWASSLVLQKGRVNSK